MIFANYNDIKITQPKDFELVWCKNYSDSQIIEKKMYFKGGFWGSGIEEGEVAKSAYKYWTACGGIPCKRFVENVNKAYMEI